MTKFINYQIEATEENAELISSIDALVMGGDSKPAKASKGKATKATKEETPDVKALCAELKELTDNATVKEILKGYDVTTPTKAAALDGDDLTDLVEELNEAIAEANEGGDESEEESDSEITVEAVKKAVQAYSKKNGKDAATEILEDFEIKTVRSLGKLDQEDLEELYAEVCE